MEHPHLRGFVQWRLRARGGYAVVWEARQLSLDRLVAVKVYAAGSEEGDRRFRRESAAAGELSDHPAIVTAHDAGQLPDGRPYLVMELYPGGSLAQWLDAAERPSAEQVRQVGVRVAAAVAAIHAQGLLHRDIRPANVLIDSYGNPGLADFGLATRADAADTAGPPQPSAYAPPESVTQPATEAGDVYALAATLYAVLTGSPARHPGAEQAVGSSSEVGRYLLDLLRPALSPDPANRPTAARLRDQLAKLPAAELPAAAPDRQLVGAAADLRQRGRRGGVLTLAVMLVAGVASVTTWLAGEPASSDVSAAATQSPAPVGQSVGPGTTPPGGGAGDPSPVVEGTIRLDGVVDSAKPFETVQIKGRYHGGADIFVRVQRWEGDTWLAFPMPIKTDQAGDFTAYVELGQPGRHRLRVLDHRAGVQSEPAVLVIED